jgi:hypothetical protein
VAGGLPVTAPTYTEQLTALKVGRKHETEFHIALHSPVTGLSWQFLVYGNSRHAANLAALTYAREETGNPTWRTLVIQDTPASGSEMMAMSREDFFSDEF